MKIINVDQEIMGGMPVFNGTRVPIKNLFDTLECGENIDDFLDGFPSVNRRQINGLFELLQQMISLSALMFDENYTPAME